MKIIPAIDIINGQCVRLSQGDYNEIKIYDSDPLAVAKRFESAGIHNLHLVDLDGAKAGRIINDQVLKSITTNTKLKVDFGGGIKTDEDIKKAFDNGAEQVTCGSIAVKNRDQVLAWLSEYGAERLILGADVKDRMVAIHGWTETSQLSIDDLLKDYLTAGLKYVICTDISTDGMLSGPNIDLYKELIRDYPTLQLIASGGVSSAEDLDELKSSGLYGAIVGKAIYENRVTLDQLTTYA